MDAAAELFVLLVQHDELAATHVQALRCLIAAQIALKRDKRGTPGALCFAIHAAPQLRQSGISLQ